MFLQQQQQHCCQSIYTLRVVNLRSVHIYVLLNSITPKRYKCCITPPLPLKRLCTCPDVHQENLRKMELWWYESIRDRR